MHTTFKSPYLEIDTPALLIDRELMMKNLWFMLEKAKQGQVTLRPHTKTHRMPELARLCVEEGARGIAVAKLGEAEVMAENGLKDIFIANEMIGEIKYRRLRALHEKIQIRIGVDGKEQIDQIEKIFADASKPLEVLIEIEVGENRSGIVHDEDLASLGRYLLTKKHVTLKGVFSHEGHCYKAGSPNECIELAEIAHKRTVAAAELLRGQGHTIDIVSIGSTPSLMHGKIAEGVTEIRPGTFILMDVGQGSAIRDFSKCAATVLASVISRPTNERVVLDAGAKSLTSQNRAEGICTTYGYGLIKNSNDVRLSGVFDEHAVLYNRGFREAIAVGDKVEVIPNHICPTCNLYEKAFLVEKGKVIEEIPVLCRGKSQ